MYSSARVRGLGRYIRRLNKEIAKIEGRTLKGLIRAGIIVMRATERQAPITPVDTGNLRASRFMVTGKSIEMGSKPRFRADKNGKDMHGPHKAAIEGNRKLASIMKNPVVILGYSAYYAAYVHEAVHIKFKRPQSGAKFFQSSFRKNQKKILAIIAKEARIKP